MSKLYATHEWTLFIRQVPPRVEVGAKTDGKPSWADYQWTPEYAEITEDVALRAVVRALVANGHEPNAVDDALSRVAVWAANPDRTMRPSGTNELMASYNAVFAHLSQGGRLRDCPVKTVEIVARNIGLSVFSSFLELEVRDFGPMPQPYRDMVGDHWDESGAEIPMPRALH